MSGTARGMYFEDFEVGMTLRTPARTITSTDIVNFACLSGDFNEVHTNFEYAEDAPFGEVIAYGPMVYGIAGGLQYASGINDGALLGIDGIPREANAGLLAVPDPGGRRRRW